MAMTVVSPEQAMQSRYYGFGGWLLVIYVLSVLGALLTLYEMVDWLSLTGASEAELAGLSGVVPVLGGFMAAVQLALALPFLVLAPMKHPMMPMVSIACLWLSVAFMIVHFAIVGPLIAAALEQIAKELPNQPGGAVPDGINGIIGLVVGSTMAVALGFSVLFSALVTWYLLVSKRVNATYRHRIPGGPALAAQLQMLSTQGMPQTGASPSAGQAL